MSQRQIFTCDHDKLDIPAGEVFFSVKIEQYGSADRPALHDAKDLHPACFRELLEILLPTYGDTLTIYGRTS